LRQGVSRLPRRIQRSQGRTAATRNTAIYVQSRCNTSYEKNDDSSFSSDINKTQANMANVFGCSDEMAQHIRTCKTGVDHNGGENDDSDKGEEITMEEHAKDTGFMISFLGTGGGIPSTRRLTSATLLRLGGTSFLFDAGEGVQRQIMYTRASVGQIEKIFITHMHADHVLGLTGLLLSLRLSLQNQKNSNKVIAVYGPAGIYNFIASNLALTQSSFNGVTVIVYELTGGDEERAMGPRGKQWAIPRDKQHRRRNEPYRDIFRDWYPEFNNRFLVRKTISRGEDGIWRIPTVPESPTSSRQKSYNIAAAEVRHLRGVQTFGFTVQEPEPPKTIDPVKATKLGIKPGPKYRQLKNGVPVMSDDGTTEIHPESVVCGTTSKARKLALIGDNCGLSPAMMQLSSDCDVLVHEATVSEENMSETAKRGHSSAEMAGQVAKSVNADVLVLNHISPRVGGQDNIEDLAARAKETCDPSTRVVVSHDFMELLVPRQGFEFDSSNEDNVAIV